MTTAVAGDSVKSSVGIMRKRLEPCHVPARRPSPRPVASVEVCSATSAILTCGAQNRDVLRARSVYTGTLLTAVVLRSRWRHVALASTALASTALATVLALDGTESSASVPTSPPGDPWTVTDVVDGDTIDVAQGADDDGPLHRHQHTGSGRVLGRRGHAPLAELLGAGPVRLERDVSDLDQFGRVLRYVIDADGDDVGALLIEQGAALARSYPPDTASDDRYAPRRRRLARGRGLWAAAMRAVAASHDHRRTPVDRRHRAPSRCGRRRQLNLNDEWVRFTNTGSGAPRPDGWTVRDESSSHRYHVRRPGPRSRRERRHPVQRLWHGQRRQRHWCITVSAVWNNGGDTVLLLDPHGNVVGRGATESQRSRDDGQGVIHAADGVGDVVGGSLGGAATAPEHRGSTPGVEGGSQQATEHPGVLGELDRLAVALAGSPSSQKRCSAIVVGTSDACDTTDASRGTNPRAIRIPAPICTPALILTSVSGFPPRPRDSPIGAATSATVRAVGCGDRKALIPPTMKGAAKKWSEQRAQIEHEGRYPLDHPMQTRTRPRPDGYPGRGGYVDIRQRGSCHGLGCRGHRRAPDGALRQDGVTEEASRAVEANIPVAVRAHVDRVAAGRRAVQVASAARLAGPHGQWRTPGPVPHLRWPPLVGQPVVEGDG